MAPLQSHHIHSLTLHWEAHFRGDGGWGRTLGVALSMKCSLLSDHLGKNNRCTPWFFFPRKSSVLVKLRPHLLPGQASADSGSLPQGTWGSLCREALSPTPETTPPHTEGIERLKK